jgi:hypothetical protein
MRAAHSIAAVIFPVLLAASGCSDGNSLAGTGGIPGTTGGHGGSIVDVPGAGGSGAGVGGSPGLGGISGAGGASTATTGPLIPAGCNVPACYGDLVNSCVPSGTCVSQSSGINTALCYSDGGKIITSLDLSTFSMAITIKKNGAVCMSMVYDSASTTGVMTIKDAAGKTVGTIADSATGDAVVTCTGQTPVTLNQSCGTLGGVSASSNTCTAGTCTP